MTQRIKSVFAGPSEPSREEPGVGHKIVSDTKQMTTDEKKGKKKGIMENREKEKRREERDKEIQTEYKQKNMERDTEVLIETNREKS